MLAFHNEAGLHCLHFTAWPKHRHVQRIFLTIVCVFMLLFAQQGALTHAAWHAGATSTTHDKGGKGGFEGSLCDLHKSLSQVTGGVPAPAVVNVVATEPAASFAGHPLPAVVVHFLAPLSRGPPFTS